MPLKTKNEDWVKGARQAMRAEMHSGAAWYMSESRGSVKLEVLHKGKKQSRILNYEWDKKGAFNAARRIIEIYKNFYSDLGKGSLAKSCEIVNTASSKSEINFDEIFKDFRNYCPTTSDKTWTKSYYVEPKLVGKRTVLPVLNQVSRLMQSNKKPVDGEDLMLKSLAQWEQGSRSRQIARRALQKFLEYAVLRSKLSNVYAPVKIQETLKKKRIGYALTDSQILELIASEIDKKWQFAYQLLATYGLRPEELRHLVVKDGELWTMYEKSMGGIKGEKTEPRKLAPLYIKDGKGLVDWNLLERISNEEELPPLGQEGKGGEALGTRLRRNKTWIKFKKQAEKLKEDLVPYAFRHRYAKVAHSRSVELGLTIKDISFVMGHTSEVHQQNYARFIPDGISDKFAKQMVA